jgi:predicted TIM-barrel fold metal-dependent hydrolase
VTVVDVDTHWEVRDLAPESHPLGPWLDQIPVGVEGLAWAIAGDALRALPAERRPDGRTLLPGLVRRAEEHGGPIILHPPHISTVAERIRWMDRVGIDHCLVNPGAYCLTGIEYVVDDRARGAARCNDFLAEQLADGSDRLHGVAIVDLSDLRGAAVELERARARGHRAFFLYTIDGRPPGNVPPGHPDWDPVWSAATDLGMLAFIHIGHTAADFSGWADIGWDRPDGAGVGGLNRLANTQRTHVAQNLLVSLLYGGAFARHPNLTVVLEEMKIGWLPWFVRETSRQAASSLVNDWPWERSGEEMLHQNVKITPLPGLGDVDALDVIGALPEMCVFSSDYPHLEGNVEPIALYGQGLDDLGTAARQRFLGDNVIDSFAMTGDPLLPR